MSTTVGAVTMTGAAPPLLLAMQLADRSGCREVLRFVDETMPPAPQAAAPVTTGGEDDDADEELPPVPVAEVTAAALQRNTWLARRATEAVVLVDLDVLDPADRDPAGTADPARRLRPVTSAAAFTVLTSSRRSHAEIAGLLDELGTPAVFLGGHAHGEGAGSVVAVCEGPGGPSTPVPPPPDDFRVVAFVTVFNEQDVLDTVLDDLERQGVGAYILDNWSTDDSWEIAQGRLGGAVIGAERWPAGGPPEHFDLRMNLELISARARELDADWYVKHDADEIRRPPWPGVTMREGLWRVQCAGYNVVDFTVINYEPVDDGFDRGVDLWEHFGYFDFGRKKGHFRQFKAWRNFGQGVDYARFGSHRIAFQGVRVFPYKFELHHYPIRSQRHGTRKVLAERQERYLPEAKQRGWHSHYDHIDAEFDFLRDPAELYHRDDTTWRDNMVELLSGAGLPREA